MALSLPSASALNDTSYSISDIAERSRQLLLCCRESFAEESRRIAGDQLSRFNLWASNIGVFSSPQACLDYRLRTAPIAKAAVEGNLEILCTHLLSGLAGQEDLADKVLDAFAEASQKEVPNFGLELFHRSLSTEQTRISALRLVEGNIDILHRLSLAIRRASNRNSLMRVPNLYDTDEAYSFVRKLEESRTTSETFVPRVRFEATSGFEYFLRLILRSRWLRTDEKMVLDQYQEVYRQFMFERCVTSISIRRRQLAYFQSHQTKLAMQATTWSPMPKSTKSGVQLSQSVSTPHLLSPSNLNGPNIEQPSFRDVADETPSETVGSEFQSTSFKPSPSTYAPSSTASLSDPGGLGTPGPFEVPPAPDVESGAKEKMCPYCCLVYPAKTFSPQRRSRRWKKHLLEDLQPYICLFKNCNRRGRTYRSFKDWEAHLSQPHDQDWLCPLSHTGVDMGEKHTFLFDIATEFQEHLNLYHPDLDHSITHGIFQAASRPAVLPQWCFVCLAEQTTAVALQKHMASHLEQAFLLALPGRDDINDSMAVSSDRPSGRDTGSNGAGFQALDLPDIRDLYGDDSTMNKASENAQDLSSQDLAAGLSAIDTMSTPGQNRNSMLENWANEQSFNPDFALQLEESIMPIKADFDHSPDQSKTANLLSIIPFKRDPDFVEPEGLLDQIYQKCTVPGSWTALVGIGGTGKSLLAIEYAYRARERSPDTWIFWVHASNAARLEQSFRDIADTVKIPGRWEPEANIFKLVQDWLHDSKNGQWLLFLENLDDARFLLDIHLDIQPHLGNLDIQSHSGNLESRASKPLRDYLPKSLNGSILITSRNREAALELVNQSDIIVVERMDEQHALALFEKKLRRQDISEDVVELAAALDFIPLAIVQAAAYISHQASHLSVREYLMMLREGVQLHRNQEAKNSVISTWQVSFEHIREIRPSACDLLSLMSFFDRQGIPECLLQSRTPYGITQQDQKGRSENNTDDKEESESQSRVIEEFEEDVSVLRNYSLICLDTHMTIFEMDEMVQLATRQWLETNGQLEKWRQQCIRNLCAEFPTGEFQNWTKCQELFPHAKSIVMQRPEEPPSSLMEWASILYKAAWYAWGQGNGSDAEKMSIMAMDTRKELLGQENVETLNSMTMVALIYDFKGRWKEAEELEVQVMATSKRVLGATHPSTLTSMNNLASTYRNQGRWNEAEELEMQAMEMRKKIFGIEHPDTLTSMSNLASTYRNQGRWDDAKELEVQVMEMRKKIFGVEHPDTLTAMDNLASTLSNKGQWKEAEELELQVMDMRKKIFGAQHPSTLTSMSNLASTYRNQGLWKEAENLDVQVIETRERVLGAEHPDTLTSMENLAFTWKGIGEDAEAMKLMEECIKLRKRILGADHPHALTSSKALAKWKAEQEDVGDKV